MGPGSTLGTAGGKTAYAHAVRRGFDEVANVLVSRGANTGLNQADRFAVAIVDGRLDEARTILKGPSWRSPDRQTPRKTGCWRM